MQVFQRRFDRESNAGQSVIFAHSDEDIVKMRLSTAQTDSIRWEASADSGQHWEEILPGGEWRDVQHPGRELLLRSTLVFDHSHPRVSPSCTSLVIEWLESPVATLLRRWAAAPRDDAVESTWTVGRLEPGARFTVHRMTCPGGSYIEIAGSSVKRSGLSFAFVDVDARPGGTYRYRVAVFDGAGARILFETDPIIVPPLPLILFQNQPNPFNPSTTIRYYLPDACTVTLGVYDSSGRLITRILDGARKPEGFRSVGWRGVDADGRPVSAGVYFYSLRAGKEAISRKMVLLK